MLLRSGNFEAGEQLKNRKINVFIHNGASKYPSTTQSILVSNNCETHVILDRTEVHKKEQPYSECISDLDSFDSVEFRATLSNGKYKKSDCLIHCAQSYINRHCGCYSVYIQNSINGKYK